MVKHTASTPASHNTTESCPAVMMTTTVTAATYAWLCSVFSQDTTIGYRPPAVIHKLSQEHNILVAFDPTDVSHAVVGCIMRIPLGAGHCELAGLYVVPEYRGRGIARQLLTAAIEDTTATELLAYTFLPKIQVLLHSFGFEQIPMWSLPFRVQVAMVVQRLTIRRLWQILRKSAHKQPMLLKYHQVDQKIRQSQTGRGRSSCL